MAAPFGPPPSLAITSTAPSGVTRESVWRAISTRMTEPSGIATGPSGKRNPDAICVNGGVIVAIFASCGPGAPGSRAGSASLDTGCTLLQDLTTAGPITHGGQRHDRQHTLEGRARGRGGESATSGLTATVPPAPAS